MTPDSSDIEELTGNGTSTPASTAAAVATSARTAITVPCASPKFPTDGYCGFALYMVSSSTVFLMYLLWALLPSQFLHRLDIYYYPTDDRGGELVGKDCAAMGDRADRTERHSTRNRLVIGAVISGKVVGWKRFWSEGTDAAMDAPIGAVCEILYSSNGEAES
ncbi:hypothetical protein P152DRAFT_514265 [Eremomyces bilateralis CBS 781.70]|uniref:PIG-P domain-containing protein n=1 Tax=Eremomyces bilateralis CBS 781.70 TaxID=1392243 RepID=A0A6G1G3I2_9PEZI|nr:uncharacterized protein P152DRAFT_514265 [Eremomyces bilateralis CBS 781.70]KAF1812665.1 hypothetical protein P152DRAFT_514265 [Eremomyces bilateralis CBS 781.70]